MNVRSWILALMAAVLGAGLVATSAGAAVVGYRFDVTPGSPCVRGFALPAETVTVTLRNRDGKRLARRSTVAGAGDGSFQVCLGRAVTPGLKLIVKGPSGGHSLVVPRFDARVDRVTDTLSGHAPAGTDIGGAIYECVPRLCAPMLVPVDLTATPQGTFGADLGTDIDGGEFVSLAYQTLDGDRIRTRADAPSMVVRKPGAGQVRLWPSRTGPVTVTLRAPGGALRASVTRTVTRGRAATFAFKRDGRAVRVRAGDRIDADFAGDVGMTAPALGLTFDVPGATVSGHCFADQWYTLTVFPTNGASSFTPDQAGPTGSFTIGVPGLQPGWKVEVLCQDARGDQLRLWGVAL